MDYELHWDNEVVADNDEAIALLDNDEAIALLEAEIAEDKAILSRLSNNDDVLGLGL